MENKRLGNIYEQKLLSFLRDNGYWCHLFASNSGGQPCDVIAIKDNEAILIDVKHCATDRFPTSRIEPNQSGCFTYAKMCGNKNVGFAIWFDGDDGFRWLPFNNKLLDEPSVRKDCLFYLEEII